MLTLHGGRVVKTSGDSNENHRQSGASIVTVLVAVGILGISAAVASRYFDNSLQESNRLRTRNNVEDLRRLIRATVDCPATMAARPSSCGKGKPTELKQRTGSASIPIPSGKIGEFELRAKCGNVPGEFVVEYKDKANWRSLFPQDLPIACRPGP